jgi:hypothetical protein
MRQKKPSQFKKCEKCETLFPVLYKTVTDNGVRKKVCQRCSVRIEQNKIKEKQAKAKAKRKEVRERITDKKLHTAFARLIKDIYPLHCHACYKPLVKGTYDTQACHFVERGKKVITWDIRNVLPGCASCNGFDQSHQYELGKNINIYWGEGMAEDLRKMRVETFQWSQPQKNQLYELFTNPPAGSTLELTRSLILEAYLKIKDS